ncbi:MAG: putative porin, partial [Prevotella sp.]|nr:putative porin [Prevotella sp.]
MKMRRLLLFCACLPLAVAAQNFNPHKSDSTSNKEVPKRLYVWTVDRHFGDIRRAEPDTLPHLYPQSTLGMGRQGEYNTVGSNYTARQNRIFTDRKETGNFLLTDAYDQSLRRPDEWHFTNTLSPITNLSYDNCGDKTNGEDHVNAFFAVNAGKKTGIGFNLDYQYARGYFQNQSTSHFGATIYGSHLGDRYQLHFLYTNNHQKATENGGIVSDGYITHPERFTESYSENEIPTVLERNWNRNNSHHIFLTHRYSVGFYRKVPMTEEEKEARKFALQSQKEKLEREAAEREQKLLDDGEENSQEEAGQGMTLTSLQPDSLQSLGATPVDSADLWMKSEYVPVTSFIHTLEANLHDRVYQAYASPRGLYADTLYNICANGSYSGDSIYDQTKMA